MSAVDRGIRIVREFAPPFATRISQLGYQPSPSNSAGIRESSLDGITAIAYRRKRMSENASVAFGLLVVRVLSRRRGPEATAPSRRPARCSGQTGLVHVSCHAKMGEIGSQVPEFTCETLRFLRLTPESISDF